MKNQTPMIQHWSASLLCSAGLYFAQQKSQVISLINLRGGLKTTKIIEQIPIDILRSLADSLSVPLFTPYSNANHIETDFKSLLSFVKKKYDVHSISLNGFAEDRTMRELKQTYESFEMKVHNFIQDKKAFDLYKEIINLGFKAHILSVNEKSLNRRFIGAPLTLEMLTIFEELNIHPFGANGEFETICTNGPNFKYGLSLTFGDVHSKHDLWFREVLYQPNL